MINNDILQQTIDIACQNVQKKGGPFAAIIVKDKKNISIGSNLVTLNNDPTAHAEIVAIRNACKAMDTFILKDCDIYCSCEPCPMCLAAIYWAQIKNIYFAASKNDAENAGFSDAFIYNEFCKSISERKIPTKQIKINNSLEPFYAWNNFSEKTLY